MDFYKKKVLVFGLGLLGGGVATTNWLLKQGARVTVTDVKSKKELALSLQKIKGKVKLSLGGHSHQDIEQNDIIVVNPDVPLFNPYIKHALKLGKQLVNEATIFYNSWAKSIVGVTGTRGKTTTVHWINHFLNGTLRSTTVGNSTEKPFLKIIDQAKRHDIAVAETPSYQLELFGGSTRSPDIAVVTNVYIDHVNHHGTPEAYAWAKANIFRYQNSDKCVILNADNQWTDKYLKQLNPKSYVWFFSATKVLPKHRNGVFVRAGQVYFQFAGQAKPVITLKDFVATHGQHNLENLLAGALAAYLAGAIGDQIRQRIATLPSIPFRQEIIYQNKKLTVINDTCATSPEGGAAAVQRFKSPNTILITGGTDRQLEYVDWIKAVKKNIKLKNIIFLSGSATQKMRKLLKPSAAKALAGRQFDSLRECLEEALKMSRKYQQSVILFSPAAKSFEKFKNEFDRGQQFNALVKKLVK